jgi:hypothetical protein
MRKKGGGNLHSRDQKPSEARLAEKASFGFGFVAMTGGIRLEGPNCGDECVVINLWKGSLVAADLWIDHVANTSMTEREV